MHTLSLIHTHDTLTTLEPPVLAVAFLDGPIAHHPVAELHRAAALDWAFHVCQAHSHQQQSAGGFAACHASDLWHQKSCVGLIFDRSSQRKPEEAATSKHQSSVI